MSVSEIRIGGYRSIRRMRLALDQINVVTGPNGSGKSNLYKAVKLLSHSGDGSFTRAVAREGGMDSVLYAGTRSADRVELNLGVTIDEWSYDLTCGVVAAAEQRPVLPGDRAFLVDPFPGDPAIKEETLEFVEDPRRPIVFMKRESGGASARDRDGVMESYAGELQHFQTALAELRDPFTYPELGYMRDQLGHWRFYHQFRTDPDSPMRHGQVVVQTPTLSHDGADVVAALATIRTMDRWQEMDRFIDMAFPGAQLQFVGEASTIGIALRTPGLVRPLLAHELSDGTLRFLALLAVLLTPYPPPFIALNEPETSLHRDLLRPLGELVALAGKNCQLLVVTHSAELVRHIEAHGPCTTNCLYLENGETKVEGHGLLDQ